MQVQKTTIESLFTHERRYLIPLFQRPYVWTQEKQWEPLWEDLRDLAERELEVSKAAEPSDEVVRPHFLGAIVLQPRAAYGDHLPVLDVIDGQQRLTTLQLLLFAMRDIAKAAGDNATTKWCTSKTENGNALVDEDVERFKVWPTQRDQAQFVEVSSAGSRAALEAKHPAKNGKKRVARPVMVEAYLYFHQAMGDWIAEHGDSHACVRALRVALQRRLELVQIDLDAGENPQEIFETLNARGVPLLASDLLRNFIFRRTKSPVHAEELHAKYWTRFEVPEDPEKPEGVRFWEVQVSQGRFSRARLDLYVQHYLAMHLERDVRVAELFREYKAWIDGKKPFGGSVEDELRAFERYADHYASLVRGETNTVVGAFGVRLAALDISTAYPLVLGLLGQDGLPPVERDGILADLESFLVRRTVCQRPTKSYTRKFLDLLRDFRAGGVFTRLAFQALLVRAAGDPVFDWPTDDEFRAAWNTIDAYRVLKPARVEMILRRIELASRSAKSEPMLFTGRLSVEHVMPQKWEKHWPLPVGVEEATAREQREEVLHDFGNLTLLTQDLNTTVSNGPAAGKLAAISDHSNLQLSKWFHGRKTWSEADIRERGKALFEKARMVWPRPADAAAT